VTHYRRRHRCYRRRHRCRHLRRHRRRHRRRRRPLSFVALAMLAPPSAAPGAIVRRADHLGTREL